MGGFSLSLFLPCPNQTKRQLNTIEKQAHEKGHSPGSWMLKWIYEPISNFIHQCKGLSNNVPTIPSEKPSEINTETACKQQSY